MSFYFLFLFLILGHTSSNVTVTYFSNDFSLVISVLYQLIKIYGSKRPGYTLLMIVNELQRLRYHSIDHIHKYFGREILLLHCYKLLYIYRIMMSYKDDGVYKR